MIQRINLLKAMPQKVTDYYSGEHILRYFGIFIGIVVTYSIFLALDYYYIAHNIYVLDKKNAEVVSLIAEAMQRPEFINMVKMQDDLSVLDNKIAIKKQVLNLLSNKSLFNTTGFSMIMQGFSKAIVKGVWLTHIIIEKGGTLISLYGKTTSSMLVPEFVKNLEINPAFAHISFVIESINNDPKGTSDSSSFVIKGGVAS